MAISQPIAPRRLHDRRLEECRAFWLAKLSECRQGRGFPTEIVIGQPPVISTEFQIDPALGIALRRVTDDSPFLTYVAIHTAFKISLSRYTGFDSVALGSPVWLADPPAPESILPIIDEIGPNRTFSEMLESVRKSLLAAWEHQDFPIESAMRQLDSETAAAVGESLNVAVGFEPIHGKWEAPAADITVHVFLSDGGFRGNVVVNGRHARASHASDFVSRTFHLLKEGVEDPERRIRDLSLIPDSELRRMEKLQGGEPEQPAGCLPKLLRTRAAEDPEGTALVLPGGVEITWRHINDSSDQLANYIRTQRGGVESPVALCLRRGLHLFTAFWGTLKSGRPYLPLDPESPSQRLDYMIRDSGATLVLTEQDLAGRFSNSGPKIVSLDDPQLEWAELPLGHTDVDPHPESPAALIYTSGSTGWPKAVCVAHGTLANRAAALSSRYRLSADDRLVQFVSPSFDAFGEELYPPLVSGATLLLIHADPGSLLPGDFLRMAKLEQATVLHVPPAYVLPLLAHLEQYPEDMPETIRLLITGGENMPVASVRQWLSYAPFSSRVANAYGPTEAVITAAVFETPEAAERSALEEWSIGRPLSGSRAYVLNRRGELLPTGVLGELYLGGSALAGRYWGRPAFTAEQFLPDSFTSAAGARMYRTGDIARWREDGCLEYLGRRDQQIKWNGYRIELGEIEAQLREHPAVSDAVIVCRTKEPLQGTIVAYYRTKNRYEPGSSELRAHLRKALPEFMLPSAMMRIASFPLTASGKIDRNALPDPPMSGSSADETHPATETESKLAQIWREVLNVEAIGLQDNFFELGGDSILSIQVVSRAAQAGIQIKPRHLFQYQTVAALAEVATLATEAPGASEIVTGPVPLTPIQHWFFEHRHDNPNHSNHSVLLEMNAPLHRRILRRAAGALLEHHDALRMRFRRGPDGWSQYNSAIGDEVVFGEVDLSAAAPSHSRELLKRWSAASQESLDIENGPLMRIIVFSIPAPEPPRVLLLVHHLVIDAVSWRILIEDLQDSYKQLLEKGQVRLPAKTASFQKWSETLGSHAALLAEMEQEYWLCSERLLVNPTPRDMPDGRNTAGSMQLVIVTLNPEITHEIAQDLTRVYRTRIEEILLAALADSLSRWTDSEYSIVEIESHGREEIDDLDISRTVGWFTALFPLVLRVGTDMLATLAETKTRFRAVPQRGIGYGLLRYFAAGKHSARELAQGPQCEISFNYLGRFDDILRKSAFSIASEYAGPPNHKAALRPHLIEFSASVRGGAFWLEWTYSENVHRRETIEILARYFQDALRAVIKASRSGADLEPEPSDFTAANLDRDKLQKILRRL